MIRTVSKVIYLFMTPPKCNIKSVVSTTEKNLLSVQQKTRNEKIIGKNDQQYFNGFCWNLNLVVTNDYLVTVSKFINMLKQF